MEMGRTDCHLGAYPNHRIVRAGDTLVYQGTTRNKLTVGKSYVVENCWSSVVQVKCDTGRIATYSMCWFEWP